MAKRTLRRPSSFIAERKEKVDKWRKNGVKAGHGGEFSDPFSDVSEKSQQKTLAFESVFEADLPLADNTPGWLVDVIMSDKEIKSALCSKTKRIESPHKQRLLQAARNPSIITTKNAEHWLQVRIFHWIEINHPEMYHYTKAVPNGGLRSKKTAADMMYEGQKAGTPDIDVDYPRGAYHGMKLEVKTDKGTAQKSQKEALVRLSKVGYYSVIEKGFEACTRALGNYFELPDFDNSTRLQLVT